MLASLAPRPVLNLTPAQLERKRAQDRLAQRATRTRTQGRIQRLEQEICELRLRTAAESNDLGPNAVQELLLRNQSLREELALLQSYVAANRGVSSDYQPGDMNSAPPSPFTGLFDNEMQLQLQSQSQSHSHIQNMYQSCVPDSLLSSEYSADPLVPNAQSIHGNHITAAEQQPEWAAVSLQNGSVLSSNLCASSRYSQTAQQHAPSCPQSFDCTCTQGLTGCETPTSEGQYVGEIRNEYTSMMVQEVDLPLNWDTYDVTSNALEQ